MQIGDWRCTTTEKNVETLERSRSSRSSRSSSSSRQGQLATGRVATRLQIASGLKMGQIWDAYRSTWDTEGQFTSEQRPKQRSVSSETRDEIAVRKRWFGAAQIIEWPLHRFQVGLSRQQRQLFASSLDAYLAR
ncbi:hypothetical protein LIA77_02276 [Sarocladium implicatum]|nr:hypothetical protein LIA77_02276 [Sarocladium implicatum]